MKKLNKDLFGWMVAAILGGVLASAGFQTTPESSAVVDLQKVVKNSVLYTVKDAEFQAQVKARGDLLKFINDNRVISADEWVKLRTISLNDKATDADKADLQKVKDSVVANTKKLAELQAKPSKSADDLTIMEDYLRRVQQVQLTARDMQDSFQTDLGRLQDAGAKAVEDQARIAVAAIGKEQGYTIVFDTLAAPYGAHDITTDSLARMNKK